MKRKKSDTKTLFMPLRGPDVVTVLSHAQQYSFDSSDCIFDIPINIPQCELPVSVSTALSRWLPRHGPGVQALLGP